MIFHFKKVQNECVVTIQIKHKNREYFSETFQKQGRLIKISPMLLSEFESLKSLTIKIITRKNKQKLDIGPVPNIKPNKEGDFLINTYNVKQFYAPIRGQTNTVENKRYSPMAIIDTVKVHSYDLPSIDFIKKTKSYKQATKQFFTDNPEKIDKLSTNENSISIPNIIEYKENDKKYIGHIKHIDLCIISQFLNKKDLAHILYRDDYKERINSLLAIASFMNWDELRNELKQLKTQNTTFEFGANSHN